jgi:hypothetical protein
VPGKKLSDDRGADRLHTQLGLALKGAGWYKFQPSRLRDWFEQARAGAAEGKIPLLAVHLAGEVRGNDLVVMRRSDFEDLLGRIETAPQALVSSHPSIAD